MKAKDITILSLEKRQAKISMLARIPTQEKSAEVEKFLSNASLGMRWNNGANKNQNVNIEATEDNFVPSEAQFVKARFRALSAIHLENRGVDFSGTGVLKKAAGMLYGEKVFTNHEMQDVYDAIGVVSDSVWDEKGEKSKGIPGINVELKIDALLNFRIARGMMTDPPVQNAVSVTVLFAFDYSHPELEKEGKFWSLLGEKVDGQVVRIIVTEILEFFEISVVTKGEDRLAKLHNAEIGEDTEDDTAGVAETVQKAKKKMSAFGQTGEKTMKLTADQKLKLGITSEDDDVPESEILKAALNWAESKPILSATDVLALKDSAKIGETLLQEKRDEVTRLAKLDELGEKEGELSSIMQSVISNANVEELSEFEKELNAKLSAKYGSGRSSKANGKDVNKAGGIDIDDEVKSTPTKWMK